MHELVLRFLDKYSLKQIDPEHILNGIRSCLEDCDCDEWLEQYLKDLLHGKKFHAVKMPIRGADTEMFEHLLKINAVRIINVYCFDDRNQIFLIPEISRKYRTFSLADGGLWCDWAEKHKEELQQKYHRER